MKRIRSIALTLMLSLAFTLAAPMSGGEVYAASGLAGRICGTWLTKKDALTDLRVLSRYKTENFGIMQGSCTDGENYAYFAFNRRDDDAVRIVKMKIIRSSKDPSKISFKYVSRSAVLKGVAHGNDMTYVHDPKGRRRDMILITTSTTGGRSGTYIGMFDPGTMTEAGGGDFKYWTDLSACSDVAYPEDSTAEEDTRRTAESLIMDKHGYSTIAYNASKNRIVATVKNDRDILILKPSWNTDGTLKKLKLLQYIRQNKNNATSQGIDIDDDYIYTCWSPLAGKLSKNILQIYDWKGNHIGNRAVSSRYELEDIFRVGNGSSAVWIASFYTSYYEPYETLKIVKVKWKKVWKTVNGQRKKVWKYKRKLQIVTEYRFTRSAYCMNLGNLRKY